MSGTIISTQGLTVDASTLGPDASIDYDGPPVNFVGGANPNVLTVTNLSEGDSVTISLAGFTADGSGINYFTEPDTTTTFLTSFEIAKYDGEAINVAVSGVGGTILTIGTAPGDVELSIVNGNYVLTDVSCFCAGTNVRTVRGDRAVETLNVGDLVTLIDGRTAPVSWLGRQTIATRFADEMRFLPIRIKANALGESLPARDLLISPDHAILVDDILVQAGALVNGVSIVRETNVPETFIYYHVEVADHSLILAENLPAETFVDNVDRMGFDNWDEHVALATDTITEMEYPRARSARQVPASMRARLLARAAALYGAEIAVAA
jgi:hypothetical protein